MTKEETIKWLGNLTIDIGEMRHQDLWAYAQAITEIGQMIADTPEVVRCKDCKHRNRLAYCPLCGVMVTPDDYFCADGERKETE